MIKIVHIADLHLDTPFSGESMEQKKQKRDELRNAFAAVCGYCIQNSIDILLIAGDLFDGDFVRRETVAYVADCLSRVPSRVFIAPGNHDAYNSASPYRYCSFPDNVHIFTEEKLEAVRIPELSTVVYGYGFNSSRMSEDPVAGIHPSDASAINILVGHGDFDAPTSAYYNIKLSDISASGLDYAALGHIHKPSGISQIGKTFCAYSGCLMGRNFGEQGTHGMITGELTKGTAALKYVSVSDKTYEEIQLDITGKDIGDIIRELQQKGSTFPAEARIRAVLVGEKAYENEAYSSIASHLAPNMTVKDISTERIVYRELLGEYSLRGAFARMLRPYMDSEDERTRTIAALSLRYGLDALKK